jgi:hypothetical protein
MMQVIRPRAGLARAFIALCCVLVLASCGQQGTPQDRAEPGALGQALQQSGDGTTGALGKAEPPKPYIVIRFDRPGITFADALYTAMTRAIDRDPDVSFDVVLAMPPLSPTADAEEAMHEGEQHIEDVVLAMTDMGLPSSRLRIAASTDEFVTVDEIRIFVR